MVNVTFPINLCDYHFSPFFARNIGILHITPRHKKWAEPSDSTQQFCAFTRYNVIRTPLRNALPQFVRTVQKRVSMIAPFKK